MSSATILLGALKVKQVVSALKFIHSCVISTDPTTVRYSSKLYQLNTFLSFISYINLTHPSVFLIILTIQASCDSSTDQLHKQSLSVNNSFILIRYLRKLCSNSHSRKLEWANPQSYQPYNISRIKEENLLDSVNVQVLFLI